MSTEKPSQLHEKTTVPLGWLIAIITTIVAAVASLGWNKVSAHELELRALDTRVTRLEDALTSQRDTLNKMDRKLDRALGVKP